jgi:hypothetical protein
LIETSTTRHCQPGKLEELERDIPVLQSLLDRRKEECSLYFKSPGSGKKRKLEREYKEIPHAELTSKTKNQFLAAYQQCTKTASNMPVVRGVTGRITSSWPRPLISDISQRQARFLYLLGEPAQSNAELKLSMKLRAPPSPEQQPPSDRL